METPVQIPNQSIQLDGMMQAKDSRRAVVITHPHPLYGGDMDNPVVRAIAKSFADNGFATLRFNFRGTGKSTGMYDEGQGEQSDVRAALAFLSAEGYHRCWLAGYSFGAWVNAAVVSHGYAVQDHVMVSPPVAFLSFDAIAGMPSTGLIVTGEADDIAPAGLIMAHIHRWDQNIRLDVIPGCDHFYSGYLSRLREHLHAYIP